MGVLITHLPSFFLHLTTTHYLLLLLLPPPPYRFFRPFYQGIYLAPLNLQSSAMFQFVFRMFSEGKTRGVGRGRREEEEEEGGGEEKGVMVAGWLPIVTHPKLL